MDGVNVVRKVRTWSQMPIIVVSARCEDTDKIEALDAGADDYLTKPFSVGELLARVRVTLRRLEHLSDDNQAAASSFVNGDLRIDYAAGVAFVGEDELHLTPIEYKLLCLLSRNVDKVLTHQYILRQVWGESQENDLASLRVFMRIIIVGGGKTGSYIAKLLASENHSIKVIEQKKTAVAKLSCDIDSANIIRGNGSDPTVLEEADILHADVVVAVTGEDEVNLVVSMP